MSLPPLVRWDYDVMAAAGLARGRAARRTCAPIDWLGRG